MTDKSFRFDKSENLKEDIKNRIQDGVKEIYNSERFKEFLKTAAKFYDYSLNNQILILAQEPGATWCAGFQKWKELGRSVNKGEKGIKIVACGEKKIKTINNQTGEEEERLGRCFFPVTVFDVSQTSGKEIVLNPYEVHLLNGSVERFDAMRNALIKESGCNVYFEDFKNQSGRGYFDSGTMEIHVSNALSQADTIRTLAHEVCHAKLHADTKEMKERGATRGIKEVEAEATAFVVCERLGIDTSSISFGYIAGWAKGKDVPELKESLERITNAATDLSSAVLKNLNIENKKERATCKAR
ncbi:ImmA/IrrE family metallo-endopeptidase [Candidatus Saccharibacteria bacterium]|jgi:antirestriction protein ArdC|nr:ImmA/IrrE family metallo-endopeptidase [Candidatus Saccharibacteria bacterium]